MIEIDGSVGEGGGQILRTSIALSALTGESVRIFKIRAGRDSPGLKPQHVTAIGAVASVCEASVEGNIPKSSEIVFTPSGIKQGKYEFDVGTAGSVTLVLQSLLPAVVSKPGDFSFRITGGTDVSWSPQADYMRNVTVPILEKIGCSIEMKLLKRGYYPKGGGVVELNVHGAGSVKPLNLSGRGEVLSINGVSHASLPLRERSVCERQALSAKKHLVDYRKVELSCEYSDAYSIGSGITLWADCGNTLIGSGCLGARELKAEDVGKKAALDLLSEIKSGACLDRYMADQIVPYIALAGGEVTVSEVTPHCRTNVWACREFGFKVGLEGNVIKSV
ncbi:MAG: RNA 3'-terminal phosphate cyclase [Candidatus Altiarchaeota archaeon]|nr:RNA 3'-terminal phosphate cyclase [Candidatus Altiarchaeota archaeon]